MQSWELLPFCPAFSVERCHEQFSGQTVIKKLIHLRTLKTTVLTDQRRIWSKYIAWISHNWQYYSSKPYKEFINSNCSVWCHQHHMHSEWKRRISDYRVNFAWIFYVTFWYYLFNYSFKEAFCPLAAFCVKHLPIFIVWLWQHSDKNKRIWKEYNKKTLSYLSYTTRAYPLSREFRASTLRNHRGALLLPFSLACYLN